MVNNEAIRAKLAEIQAEGKSDHEWWEQKRATIQSNFMKELDQDTTLPPTTSSPGSGSVSIPTVAGLQSASTPANSDEDTVLVEGGGPATSGGSAKGGTAARKRKGRK